MNFWMNAWIGPRPFKRPTRRQQGRIRSQGIDRPPPPLDDDEAVSCPGRDFYLFVTDPSRLRQRSSQPPQGI